MKNENCKSNDARVFEYDGTGNNICGVKYPFGIKSNFMCQFKTGAKPKEKVVPDLQSLCKKFSFTLPK